MSQFSVLATLQAQGSPSNLNTHQSLVRLYANCGRWQNGATNFVAVSEFDVVLASYRNYNEEAANGRRKWTEYAGVDAMGEPIYIDQIESDENYSERIAAQNIALSNQILSPKLKSFITANNCYIHTVQSYLPIDCDAIQRAPDTEKLYRQLLKSFPTLMPEGEVLFTIPDCHITLFREWLIDGFCKPSPNSGKTGNYYQSRVSLDKDLQEFYTAALTCAGSKSNVVQVGDLYDNWHIQWMYELAFDIYVKTKNKWFFIFQDRFPVELLDSPSKALAPTLREKLLDNWAEHFHEYLTPSGSANTGNADSVLKNWHSKVRVMDVLAIVLWGMGLSSVSDHFTPLSAEDFLFLKNALLDPETVDGVDHIPQISSNANATRAWALIRNLRKSVGAPEMQPDVPLNVLAFNETEERIRKTHSTAISTLEAFQECSNFVRGNHDTEFANKYLAAKFENFSSGFSKEDFTLQKNSALVLDDKEGNCPPSITLKRGTDKRIFIEHGDAWDRQNNNSNYYLYKVGHPWFDIEDEHFWSSLSTVSKSVNGGYHMPKDDGLLTDAYNVQQMKNPDGVAHILSQWLGDMGLEPPTELRMRALFIKSPSPPALVILGHTHLKKLEHVSITDEDLADVLGAGRLYT